MKNQPRETHFISLKFYTLEELQVIVDERSHLELSKEVAQKIDAGARYIQQIADQDRYIYGVNTGFGSFASTIIPDDKLQ